MREIIRESVRDAVTLAEVRDGLLRVFVREKRGKDGLRIGYVSGIITSDGPAHIEENIQRLAEYTERIREREGVLTFSPVDVFDDALFARLKADTLPQESWWIFWREVLGSGHVTDIYMTPRWQESTGARDEHETASKLGIVVHYESEKLA